MTPSVKLKFNTKESLCAQDATDKSVNKKKQLDLNCVYIALSTYQVQSMSFI